MNDSELLEFAATAIGDPLLYRVGETWERITGYSEQMGCDILTSWNPLLYDSDAFVLAVKLSLEINIGTKFTLVVSKPLGKGVRVMVEQLADPIEATRIAIVRAAAEIGKSIEINAIDVLDHANENCKSNQHEYEYVDDSFSDGFYSSSGGHYQCCNCGHKASTKEVDGN